MVLEGQGPVGLEGVEDTQGMVTIRPVVVNDAEECSRILYEAFKSIAERHNFPPDTDPERARSSVRHYIGHARIFGVVAEADGRVVGFNFLREFNTIRGVGPIGVDPAFQGRGVGRRLMAAVLERARGAPGVRLVQDAFNGVSLSLYASLGFVVMEPLVLMEGRLARVSSPSLGMAVRHLVNEDRVDCAALCRRTHGFEREELWDALEQSRPVVAEHQGRIVAYASAQTLGLGTHGVAETEEDMRELLIGLFEMSPEPMKLLVPLRSASFFRWCLEGGLRVVKPMNLMAMGAYQEPQGCFFPSVAY
jgi:ribosomal protein S18 acetylase RimI-like enzyme